MRKTLLMLSLGLLLSLGSQLAIAQTSHNPKQPIERSSEFQRIHQPLWLKTTVTAAGLGLIGLELWWFLFSKLQNKK